MPGYGMEQGMSQDMGAFAVLDLRLVEKWIQNGYEDPQNFLHWKDLRSGEDVIVVGNADENPHVQLLREASNDEEATPEKYKDNILDAGVLSFYDVSEKNMITCVIGGHSSSLRVGTKSEKRLDTINKIENDILRPFHDAQGNERPYSILDQMTNIPRYRN